MSVTHFSHGFWAAKSRFNRSSDLRASRSALVIQAFGVWVDSRQSAPQLDIQCARLVYFRLDISTLMPHAFALAHRYRCTLPRQLHIQLE